jgi:tetratricopeptide (TPR) repeat protein
MAGCVKKSEDYFRNGQVNVQKHQYKEALADYNDAIRIDTSNAQAYLERAHIACKTGNTVPIDEDLSKYIQFTAPKLADAYRGRALARQLTRQIDSSLDDVNKAIALEPGNIQAYKLKEEILIESGDSVHLKEFRGSTDEQIRRRLQGREKSTAGQR